MKKWAIPLVWCIGIAASLRFDPLIVIGLTSLILTSWLIATEAPLFRSLFIPTPRLILLGIAAAAVMLVVTYGVMPIFIRALPSLFGDAMRTSTMMRGGRTPLHALMYVLPIVVAEELIWRGAFEEWIGARRFGTAFICAFVYAIAHASRGSLLLVIVALICGIYWSLLREWSRSLWPPLIAHLVWDTAIVLAPLTMPS